MEVPDYLLQRSRERRAALGMPSAGGPTPSAGGDGGDGGDSPAAPSTTGAASPAPAAGAPAVPQGGGSAPAAPSRSSPPAPALGLPPELLRPASRTGLPGWMIPVLFLLPFWVILYLGGFGTTESGAALSPIQSGAQVYGKSCGSCHGARGEGGVGPKLAGGETKLTFPDEAQHVAWVEDGSAATKGQPYGDPARPGGARTAGSGGMPGFKGTLTPEQIKHVVAYEREALK